MSSGPEEESPEGEVALSASSKELEVESESAMAESWPEAGPEWSVAKPEWKEAWPFHVYFFAVAFLLLSLMAAYLAVFSLVQHKGGPRSAMNKTVIALNVMICLFTLTRTLFLLIDPYFSLRALPFVAVRLLWSFGIPGFTATFSIMLLILLDTTKMSVAPPRYQNVKTVVLIWLLHLVIVMTTDVLVLYAGMDMRPMLMVCQMLFTVYGVLVFVGYAYVGVKIKINLIPSSQPSSREDHKLRRLVTMTFLSSGVALCVVVVNIYTAFSEFGPYAGVSFVDPWPYWGIQTISRFLELAGCSLVLMLFLRSGSGGLADAFCFSCHPRQQKAVAPNPEFGKSSVATTDVTGLEWRQRTETSTLCHEQK